MANVSVFDIKDIPMWNIKTQKPVYPFREGGIADGKIITPPDISIEETIKLAEEFATKRKDMDMRPSFDRDVELYLSTKHHIRMEELAQECNDILHRTNQLAIEVIG